MRDYRINKIFEGSSEIMHLFMAREMVDKHLQVAGAMIDPEKTMSAKLAALPKMGAFYAAWYPTRWVGWGRWPRYGDFGELATHLRFVERSARKLARASFHGMLRYQAALQNKQAFLFRLVDVANELFAMAATVARARALADQKQPEAAEARRIADLFCRIARRRVRQLFGELWDNDDVRLYRGAVDVLEGRHEWLERGTMGLGPVPAPAGEEEAEAEPKTVAVGVS
jgi:alkylation response protein AidB-like acyl-CoA dehydrogenase